MRSGITGDISLKSALPRFDTSIWTIASESKETEITAIISENSLSKYNHAYSDSVDSLNQAYEAVRDYFRKNIIHRGISVDKPVDGVWMKLSVGVVIIYVAGPEEAKLVGKFIERRKADLTQLVNAFYLFQDKVQVCESLKPSPEFVSKRDSAIAEGALMNLRIAELNRRFEYIEYVSSILLKYKDTVSVSNPLPGA